MSERRGEGAEKRKRKNVTWIRNRGVKKFALVKRPGKKKKKKDSEKAEPKLEEEKGGEKRKYVFKLPSPLLERRKKKRSRGNIYIRVKGWKGADREDPRSARRRGEKKGEGEKGSLPMLITLEKKKKEVRIPVPVSSTRREKNTTAKKTPKKKTPPKTKRGCRPQKKKNNKEKKKKNKRKRTAPKKKGTQKP